jgi:hypothetical protein
MKLKVLREEFSEHSTIGKLYVNGIFECYTLEDVVRPDGVKVFGETAIPRGIYKVIVDLSNRFKRLLPLLIGVSQFEGIRIHPGNTDKDTHGCILVGTSKQKDFIGNSRGAFNSFFPKLQAAIAKGEEVTIEITGGN